MESPLHRLQLQHNTYLPHSVHSEVNVGEMLVCLKSFANGNCARYFNILEGGRGRKREREREGESISSLSQNSHDKMTSSSLTLQKRCSCLRVQEGSAKREAR